MSTLAEQQAVLDATPVPTPTTSLMQLPVKERNAAYKALTPRGKAKAIAQDILDQLDAKKYQATQGTFFRADLHNAPAGVHKEKQLQNILIAPKVVCEVCARGAAFASAVRLGNRCKTDPNAYYRGTQSANTHTMDPKLKEAFSEAEFLAMEVVFEKYDRVYFIEKSDQKILFFAFINKHFRTSNPTILLRRVAQNILDNDGEFKIPGVELAAKNKK